MESLVQMESLLLYQLTHIQQTCLLYPYLLAYVEYWLTSLCRRYSHVWYITGAIATSVNDWFILTVSPFPVKHTLSSVKHLLCTLNRWLIVNPLSLCVNCTLLSRAGTANLVSLVEHISMIHLCHGYYVDPSRRQRSLSQIIELLLLQDMASRMKISILSHFMALKSGLWWCWASGLSQTSTFPMFI